MSPIYVNLFALSCKEKRAGGIQETIMPNLSILMVWKLKEKNQS